MLSTKWLIFTSAFLLNTSYILTLTDNYGVIRPGGKSFAEQVTEIAKNYNNNSVTIFVKPGRYYSTNGSHINFINFTNIIIKKDPNITGTVEIECLPENLSLSLFNGNGFDNGVNISISDLSISRCGPRSSGLYIFNVTNLEISDSTFHHNTDNGLQMVLCNNIVVRNCHFHSSVGLQPDINTNLFQQFLLIHLEVSESECISETKLMLGCPLRTVHLRTTLLTRDQTIIQQLKGDHMGLFPLEMVVVFICSSTK